MSNEIFCPKCESYDITVVDTQTNDPRAFILSCNECEYEVAVMRAKLADQSAQLRQDGSQTTKPA